jgi:hypothetical protein
VRRNATTSNTASPICRRPQPGRGSSPQNTTSGATTTAPVVSPSHQVSQIEGSAAGVARPDKARLAAPTVAAAAAAAGIASPAATNTPDACRNAAVPPARETSAAPTNPSSVLPAAIASDESTWPVVVMLTRKAPTAMAGHRPRPPSSSAASATPAGGHTALALAWVKASDSPSLPAAT